MVRNTTAKCNSLRLIRLCLIAVLTPIGSERSGNLTKYKPSPMACILYIENACKTIFFLTCDCNFLKQMLLSSSTINITLSYFFVSNVEWIINSYRELKRIRLKRHYNVAIQFLLTIILQYEFRHHRSFFTAICSMQDDSSILMYRF